jgi:hypothetical protein
LAVLLPPGKDPGIALRLAALDGWRSAWATLGEQQRRLVTYAWVLAHPAIAGAVKPWRAVRGTMTGVIATLLDLGWAPVAPSRWLAPSRQAYADLA